MIWVSWYKKSSKIPTDVTEDVIRNYALKNDLVDVKVCAVSDTWSGLKLVVPFGKKSTKNLKDYKDICDSSNYNSWLCYDMHPKNISIIDFTYNLPEEKIAKYPLAERDASKLLIYKEGNIKEDIYQKYC